MAKKEKPRCVGCGEELTSREWEEGEPRVCLNCWRCPKCGASERENGKDGCIIDDEFVNCYSCEEGFTFGEFERAIIRKGKMKPCSVCHGTGLVKKEV